MSKHHALASHSLLKSPISADSYYDTPTKEDSSKNTLQDNVGMFSNHHGMTLQTSLTVPVSANAKYDIPIKTKSASFKDIKTEEDHNQSKIMLLNVHARKAGCPLVLIHPNVMVDPSLVRLTAWKGLPSPLGL